MFYVIPLNEVVHAFKENVESFLIEMFGKTAEQERVSDAVLISVAVKVVEEYLYSCSKWNKTNDSIEVFLNKVFPWCDLTTHRNYRSIREFTNSEVVTSLKPRSCAITRTMESRVDAIAQDFPVKMDAVSIQFFSDVVDPMIDFIETYLLRLGIKADEWSIWHVRNICDNIVIEHSLDFRIYDWERQHGAEYRDDQQASSFDAIASEYNQLARRLEIFLKRSDGLKEEEKQDLDNILNELRGLV